MCRYSGKSFTLLPKPGKPYGFCSGKPYKSLRMALGGSRPGVRRWRRWPVGVTWSDDSLDESEKHPRSVAIACDNEVLRLARKQGTDDAKGYGWVNLVEVRG